MQVRHLTLCVRGLFAGSPVDLTHRAFSAVTHLEMFDDVQLGHILDLLTQIPVLPVLTHLSLKPDVPRDDILTVLAQCPRLHILLVCWFFLDDEYATARLPHVYDVRFVIGTWDLEYWTEREAGARGEPDHWSCAADFIARKRRGEIEATHYWMD
ncbi:hypothetical protein C8R46DRAFT_1229616 [Mycena filopes]|nr:hypothetical protein C8R46DRAFT_1229616 [Mycena filopes]